MFCLFERSRELITLKEGFDSAQPDIANTHRNFNMNIATYIYSPDCSIGIFKSISTALDVTFNIENKIKCTPMFTNILNKEPQL